MTALVTVEQVDRALSLDLAADGDDVRRQDVELKIEQASDIVLDYITAPEKDDWAEANVPPRVSAAVMLVIQSLFDDGARGEMLKGLAGGDLTNPVVALLYRLRDPALA